MAMIPSNSTYQELLRHLDLTTVDPVVRLLVNKLTSNSIYRDLLDAGMDPVTETFDSESGDLTPADYIDYLRSERDYYRREADEWEGAQIKALIEIENLKARSIAQLLTEMESEISRSKRDSATMSKKVDALTTENQKLHEKINVWKTLES